MRPFMFSKFLLMNSLIYSSCAFQMGYFDPKDKIPICMPLSTLSTWHFANCFLGIRSFHSQNVLEKLSAIDSST